MRLNGVPSISTGIIRNATANPLEVADGVRALMPQIQRDLPASVTVHQANDNSVFIDRSIKAVYTTVVEAVVLVALVVFVFLRTLRASIIPLVTIPVSLIGAFALIALAGFTVNTLTLLALVLAIGLVVDDAIVVLENIFRHIEEGLTPFQAATQGRARDQLRRRRDDAHAGGGVRAAGLHARAHRAAVQRVRAHAGRRGAGVGLRGADADADDVQQAAAPQPERRTASTAGWRPCWLP